MDARPAPLVPEVVDLRDFAFLPLEVVRLRDSGLTAKASGDEFRAAVLLWCAAWHQTPAASLPDDDEELANLCGYGRTPKEWAKIKQRALTGFVLCTDGRLYHKILSSKAIEAWRGKLRQRWVTETARVKKHNSRHNTAHVVPEFEVWVSLGCPQGQTLHVQVTEEGSPQTVKVDRPSKREGQGQGERKGQGEGEGQGEKEEELGAAKLRPKRKAPANFAPSPEMLAWASTECPSVDAKAETAKFLDHTFARTITDWDGAWRNWLRKASENMPRRPGQAMRNGPPDDAAIRAYNARATAEAARMLGIAPQPQPEPPLDLLEACNA
jgi:hypothetical protein